MVNDLLNERYPLVRVHYMVLLSQPCLTIDNERLSMVIDYAPQISVSVALDGRKPLVFRPSGQISARFGGTVFALDVTSRGPPL